ncbi:MAG: hypothetical protein H6667_12560 [Ardenticatenaceae bacterium]|nr:hypothetical protein [Ardenticatenaceae bacterium]
MIIGKLIPAGSGYEAMQADLSQKSKKTGRLLSHRLTKSTLIDDDTDDDILAAIAAAGDDRNDHQNI